MNRLDFLKQGITKAMGVAVATVGLSGILGAALSSCNENPPKTQKVVGLQLYSLRDSMATDPVGTLKAVADMGYTSLETAGYSNGKLYGYTPEEFRKIVEGLGMKVTGAHVGRGYNPEQDTEIMEWWNTAFDANKAAGCTYVIMPSMPIGETLEELKVYCDYYNRLGEMAKGKGIKFGFHNHAAEFKTVEDQVVLDYLIENTDPQLVTFELDVYWVLKGGADPVAYINKYPGRIGVLHIKDESTIGESGTVDFEAIFNAANAQGIKDYYVEVERYTQPPLNCVQRSFDFLETAAYVK
ncbi:Sugar phosphate isomerase/epimerase [Mucinivorans hirudinis]|uniref:Sugar phosphate isomerase/epimerase n=1 Tax=Mucinivorans hirudinis TaxID=1433126 RepID=A0A060R7V9_9BACT|nr:Sugar phosphate isomerase/epimerase [Mucinivorans hirudinis]